MSACSDLILKATDASGDDVTIIENIMREERFHSTIDWQPRCQLTNAALAAETILRENTAYSHLALADRRVVFEESKLHESQEMGTPGSAFALARHAELEAIQQSLWNTRQSLQRPVDLAFPSGCPK
jgi:hypothetical protein